MSKKKAEITKRVLLVDGNNYLCRGGFATPPLTDKKGNPTNAIKGFMAILMADITKLKPSHVVVTWDKGGKKNWRKELYPEYKGNRKKGKEMPQAMIDILAQAHPLRKLLKTVGIRTSCRAGEEADDIIGTLAVQFGDDGYHVIIGSKDKDFAQLVNENINMLVAESRELLNDDGIKAKFGVWPEQIQDYLVLQGDGIDNIPGVFRCGGVTAAKLLTAHQDLKGIKKNKHSMTPALLKNYEAAEPLFKLTKQLVKIKTDLPLKTSSSNCKLPSEIEDEERFSTMCYRLNLKQTEVQIRKLLSKGK
jgi:DNA polymerase-1